MGTLQQIAVWDGINWNGGKTELEWMYRMQKQTHFDSSDKSAIILYHHSLMRSKDLFTITYSHTELPACIVSLSK
jgi:hypothetical protein